MGLLSKKVPKPEDVYNAVKQGNVDEVKKLLAAGGSPEKHEDGFTADVCVHAAANKGRKEILQLLIDHKANVNRQNKLGSTALHCAAGYGYDAVVTTLLAAGASKDLRDAEGKTPADLAKMYSQAQVCKLLE
mmetsp:Transcript_8993/g.23858  ORF Transcript_8993/g.23858 Transcript_8993/m.23858 type:complete len:132 (-) Transcript_8993:562-957(-)